MENQNINKRYTREEEKEISLQIAKGNLEIRSSFIENNLGLARSFAISYTNKYKLRVLTKEDLIQEATIGLIKAADKFDGSMGYKFSTYAGYWIRQSMDLAILTKEKGISISRKKLEKVRKLKAIEAKLEQTLNRQPSLEELVKESNMSQSEVEEIYQYQYDTISLNERINTDGDKEFGELVQLDEETLEEIVTKSNMKSIIKDLIETSHLTEIEKEVVFLYYGSNMSYEKIGKILGFSRQNTKIKLEKALMKFRMRKDIKSYAVYMDNPDAAEENIDIFQELYNDPEYGYGGKSLEKFLPTERKR